MTAANRRVPYLSMPPLRIPTIAELQYFLMLFYDFHPVKFGLEHHTST